MSSIKQQVCMYLWYTLVITYMFIANVQAIITSYEYLAIQNVLLPELSPVVLDCLTLELSRYSTSKISWLPSSWLKDVRTQKTWIHRVIAVITWNVASKLYCLLQVLVAALLLVSCAAFVKRYPDPVEKNKYYLRIDGQFYHLTCPNKLVFDNNIEQCIVDDKRDRPVITPLTGSECNQNMPGYLCGAGGRFTYCTHDGLEILKEALCPDGKSCTGSPSTTPCGWYTCST